MLCQKGGSEECLCMEWECGEVPALLPHTLPLQKETHTSEISSITWGQRQREGEQKVFSVLFLFLSFNHSSSTSAGLHQAGHDGVYSALNG